MLLLLPQQLVFQALSASLLPAGIPSTDGLPQCGVYTAQRRNVSMQCSDKNGRTRHKQVKQNAPPPQKKKGGKKEERANACERECDSSLSAKRKSALAVRSSGSSLCSSGVNKLNNAVPKA